MAGHNKWSKIKHKKGAADDKRSKVWTKVVREITVAAKMGGSDADTNPRLRKAIDDAKAANMPKDTMNRAIQKGSAGKDGADFEELVYEGYGPNGVALLVECLTDNRNRTSSDVRSLLNKRGGKMGTTGSVSYGFNKKGQLVFEKAEYPELTEDILLEKGLEYGIEDVQLEDNSLVVWCAPNDFQQLRERLADQNLKPSIAEILMVPDSVVGISGDQFKTLLKLIELLEDLDDVQNVWSNMDVAEQEPAKAVIEKVFVSKNIKSALYIDQARGSIITKLV